MRYSIFLFILLVPCLTLQAQRLVKHKKKGKWGFVEPSFSKKKKVVIPYQFQQVGKFKKGVCPAKKKGKWGYIDKKGNEIYPFELEEAESFYQPAALVKKGDKFGALNPSGQIVIPISHDTLIDLKSHFVFFENEKAGVLDSVGKVVLAAEYDEIKGGYPDYLIVREGTQTYKFENGEMTEKEVSELIFSNPDELAYYEGCQGIVDKVELKKCSDEKMLTSVYRSIRYPADAREMGVQGMVVASFTIDENGNINDPMIVRDIGAGCGEEVLRMVRAMPKWFPAKEGGVNVASRFNLPVRFRLE